MNGFYSNAATRFIKETNVAITNASDAHSKNPLDGKLSGPGSGSVTPPSIPPRNNVTPPFADDISQSGSHRTGVGNSSNIVVDMDIYRDTMRAMDMVDDEVGAEIYKTCIAIEELCSKSFIVPETVPRILEIASQMKSCLGQFRSLTEDVRILAIKYADEIIQLD